LIFSVDGNVPSLSSDKTNLIVGKSFSEVATVDKEQFCETRLRQMPIEIVSIEYTKPLTIDSLSGYEIYAKAKTPDTDEVENTYQVILFDDGLYYILLGSTNDESDDSMSQLRNAVMTFKRK